jgi:hypothetical protein
MPNVVFEGIEQAILSAARKHFSEEEQLEVRIDRETGRARADLRRSDARPGTARRPAGANLRPNGKAGNDSEDPRSRARSLCMRSTWSSAASRSPGR